jgi:hypothetical protein
LILTLSNSGGSILTALLESKHESIRNLKISVLVRDEQKGATLAKEGVSSIYFKGFDDADTIKAAASENDSRSSGLYLQFRS